MENIKEYIEEHKDRFLSELIELLKIPSISADPAYAEDVKRAADFIVDQFKSLNVDKVEVYPTAGNPIVYAEKSP